MDMALALIEQLTERFHPEKYHDTYSDELMRVINERMEGKEPEEGEPAPRSAPRFRISWRFSRRASNNLVKPRRKRLQPGNARRSLSP